MIGIFDSGLGGLISFKEIHKLLPQYSYIYLGDTLRAPYGGRSQETVYEFTKKAVDFLFRQGCNLIIIACNTASSEALRKLQQEYLPLFQDKSKNILGVVRPLAEEAIEISHNRRIAVVGTQATINSNVYERELKNLDSHVQVFQKACPLLVPLIEENHIHKPETKKILKNYLRNLKDSHSDTLILACTHYPVLFNEFQRIMGKKVQVIDSSQVIARKLKEYLKNHPEIEKNIEKNQKTKYLVTDLSQNFQKMSQRILNKKVNFQKIDID